jgi:hypothetical protein
MRGLLLLLHLPHGQGIEQARLRWSANSMKSILLIISATIANRSLANSHGYAVDRVELGGQGRPSVLTSALGSLARQAITWKYF